MRLAENLAVIKSLRAHPSLEAENVLLQLARTDSAYRGAAIASLGWWEPIHRQPVQETLKEAQCDPALRDIALAALARLGEVAALSQFQHRFTNANPEVVHHTFDLLMDEGVSLLWPDLDELTEHDDSSVASHAWEVLERMRESFLGPLG